VAAKKVTAVAQADQPQEGAEEVATFIEPDPPAAAVPVVEVPPQVAAPDEGAAAMSVSDYLMARSVSDRRVELLAGFLSFAGSKGLGRLTLAQFDAEFSAFVNTPV
jgi:hypothetical protein